MSNIPLARRKLMAIANELKVRDEIDLATKIEEVVQENLYRAKQARRMPVKSNPMSTTIAEAILELAESTDLQSSEIAAELGINPGRVSEVLQARTRH